MGLFGKKPAMWWEKGHATGKVMSKVEEELFDRCLAYRYDNAFDRFFVALQRMETGGRRIDCVITHPRCNKVRITTYTSLPMIAEPGEVLLHKFDEIHQESEFVNLQVEKKYGFVIITYDFEDVKGEDWLQYLLPVMIEHARVVDEYYDDIRASYPKRSRTTYPYLFSIPDLNAFAKITLNKVCRIGEDVAIVHKKYETDV